MIDYESLDYDSLIHQLLIILQSTNQQNETGHQVAMMSPFQLVADVAMENNPTLQSTNQSELDSNHHLQDCSKLLHRYQPLCLKNDVMTS